MSAQVTITQLPAAGAITGTESVPIVQNGQTVRTTTGAIAASPTLTATFLTKNQEPTLTNSRYLSTNTGITLTDGGAQSYYQIGLTGAVSELNALGGGIVVKNGAGTLVNRSIATSGAGLSVSNGDGSGANPTLALSGVAAAVANLSGTGMLALVSGGTSVAGRDLIGTANQITITNGNGASGNPTFAIASNAVLPGTGGVVVPNGTTAQTPAGTSGQIRYNTDSQVFEGYANGSWNPFSLAGGVSTFSAGSTGFTPSTASSGVVTLGGVLNVSNGGTGAGTLTGYVKGAGTSAMTASATIPNTDISGLGTMSTQNASAVAITGGTVAGATITGSTINSTTIGAGTAAAGTFTSVTMTTGTISTAPTNNTDIVNKEYADAIASGINFHQSCRLATTTALAANTYNNGASGVGATLTANANGALSVDSVAVVVGNRILVKNEVTQANNGVYTVTQTGSAGAPYILTRASDFDTAGSGVDKIDAGDFFLITAGATLANTSWVQQTPLPITVGTTAIVFAQFGAPLTYTAGTGLSESPSYTFNIANTGVTAATYGSASQVPVLAVNAQGQLTSVTNTSIAIASGAVSGLAASATTDTTNATNITSGTLPTGRISGSYTGITGVGTLTAGTWNGTAIGIGYGGTGLTATPTNGQLAIGNGTGYTLANLTAGTNVSISNTSGGITISATPSAGGTVTSVDMSVPSFLSVSGNPITVSGTLAVTYSGTPLPVANGGTGATTLAGYLFGNGTSAVTASTTIPSTAITGLGSMASQNANSVAITGGTIDGTAIGSSTVSTVRASTVTTTGTGSPTDGAGQVYLNGATSNRIDFNTNGTGAPAFTTRSVGTKLVLYPSLSSSVTDYAMGIAAATMWSSVPENNSGFKFKWYGATTEVASLDGAGAFTAVGGISGGTF
jgi:hypothetical protein